MKFPILPTALLVCAATGVYGQEADLLRAKFTSQRTQNARADAERLSRIQDVPMIRRYASRGLLSPVPASTRTYYLHAIPAEYQYIRPWAKTFLDDMGRDFHKQFRSRLRVTSMIRTVEVQNRLRLHNVNAAAAHGNSRSSHLTGATLDISKRDMTDAQIRWARQYLHALHQRQVIYAVEEFSQPTFHVMVHRSYSAPDTLVASAQKPVKVVRAAQKTAARKKAVRSTFASPTAAKKAAKKPAARTAKTVARR